MCLTGASLKHWILRCRLRALNVNAWTKLDLLIILLFQYIMTLMSTAFAVMMCCIMFLPSVYGMFPLDTEVLEDLNFALELVVFMSEIELLLHLGLNFALLLPGMPYERNLIPAIYTKVLSTMGKVWRTVAFGIFLVTVFGSGILSFYTWTQSASLTVCHILAYFWSMWDWHKLCTVFQYIFSNSELGLEGDEEVELQTINV